jgi:hypothetical protein
LLLESGVGEVIFFAGNKHAAIKVVASYVEDQIVTTNPQQLLKQEKAKQELAQAQRRAQEEAQKGGGQSDQGGARAQAEGVIDLDEDAKEAQAIAEAEKVAQDAASALLTSESAGKAEADKIRDSLKV